MKTQMHLDLWRQPTKNSAALVVILRGLLVRLRQEGNEVIYRSETTPGVSKHILGRSLDSDIFFEKSMFLGRPTFASIRVFH